MTSSKTYILVCEKHPEDQENYFYFLPSSLPNSQEYTTELQALHYMIYYADWEDGAYRLEIDMNHLKEEKTVEDMISSAYQLGTEFPMFQKVTGRFQWPFPVSPTKVVDLSPREMGNLLSSVFLESPLPNHFV